MASDAPHAGLVALLACGLGLAGCTGGLSGSASVVESPAAASDLSLQKARDASRRESNGAQCFGAAVLDGVVERLPLTPTPGAAPPTVTPMSAEQARRLIGAADANLVPVYCRNAEPAGVQPTKSPDAKLHDAALWFPTRAMVVAGAPVEATVRAYGDAHYKRIETHDTGYKREVLYDRAGAVTNDANAPLHGGSRRLEPIIDYTVHTMDAGRSVDVPGRYTEAWILVQVARDRARAYRSACASLTAGALRGGANDAPPRGRYEAERACSLYQAGPAAAIERPPIVPLNPEEAL